MIKEGIRRRSGVGEGVGLAWGEGVRPGIKGGHKRQGSWIKGDCERLTEAALGSRSQPGLIQQEGVLTGRQEGRRKELPETMP